jgi:hypothetical protein
VEIDLAQIAKRDAGANEAGRRQIAAQVAFQLTLSTDKSDKPPAPARWDIPKNLI